MVGAKTIKRNTLSHEEVSLIKGLLNTEQYSNQEIAGLINRARGSAASDVSSGRISNIKNNQISKYRSVLAASSAALEKFLDQVAELAPSSLGPTHPSRLAKLLSVRSRDPLTLNITETEIIECKRSLNVPMKTIAAFANNRGGYLIFGVENRTWKVEGLHDDKFEKYDLNKLNQNIRDSLGICIGITPTLYEIEGRKIGVFYIAPAHTKPVIFIHNAEGQSQGQIYFRYPGEDRLIAPPDLQNIIENRIRQLSETVLAKHLATLLRFGLDNSAVLNVATGEVQGKSGSFLVDESLLPKLHFIKDGEFVERSGAPALRLIGDVTLAKPVAVYSSGEVIENYPKTYRDMLAAIRAATTAKESDIQRIIKRNKIKRDETYSHYLFSTIKDRDAYRATGKVSSSTRSLYNQAAIDFIVKELNAEKSKTSTSMNAELTITPVSQQGIQDNAPS